MDKLAAAGPQVTTIMKQFVSFATEYRGDKAAELVIMRTGAGTLSRRREHISAAPAAYSSIQ